MTLDKLIARWCARRDRITKSMRELDGLADAGYPDTGGYLLLETELGVVRETVADLRRLARRAKAGAS